MTTCRGFLLTLVTRQPMNSSAYPASAGGVYRTAAWALPTASSPRAAAAIPRWNHFFMTFLLLRSCAFVWGSAVFSRRAPHEPASTPRRYKPGYGVTRDVSLASARRSKEAGGQSRQETGRFGSGV